MLRTIVDSVPVVALIASAVGLLLALVLGGVWVVTPDDSRRPRAQW